MRIAPTGLADGLASLRTLRPEHRPIRPNCLGSPPAGSGIRRFGYVVGDYNRAPWPEATLSAPNNIVATTPLVVLEGRRVPLPAGWSLSSKRARVSSRRGGRSRRGQGSRSGPGPAAGSDGESVGLADPVATDDVDGDAGADEPPSRKGGGDVEAAAREAHAPAFRAHFLPVGRTVVWLANGHPCPWHLTTTVALATPR